MQLERDTTCFEKQHQVINHKPWLHKK